MLVSCQSPTTSPTPASSAPTGLTATPGNAQMSLSWTAVSGATSYKVYRSTTSGTKGTQINTLGSVTTANYTDTSVTIVTTYYYEVTAVNAGVESAPSSQVSPDITSANIGTLKGVHGGTFALQASGPNMTESSFHMSQNLITGAQYAAVTGLTDPSNFTETNHPVETVNWYGALVFCNKLSMVESLTPVYSIGGSTDPATWGTIPTADNTPWDAVTMNTSASGYRLPTEMQDMWAAMGGMSDGLARDIVGGVNTLGYAKGYAGSTEASIGQTNIGNYAWYSVNSSSTTHPVGTKTANELGIYDLSGNVGGVVLGLGWKLSDDTDDRLPRNRFGTRPRQSRRHLVQRCV